MSRSFTTPLVLALALVACGDDEGDGITTTSDDATAGGDTSTTTTTTTNTATDAATGDTQNACDPVEQSGCEDNQNCTFVANQTVSTCQPEGTVPPEEPCSSESRCQVGVCLNLNQTESLCYQFCEVDADCGPSAAAGSCLTLSNATFRICKIAGIYDTCSLLTQDCADTAKSCYAVANETEPICLTTGTKTLGNGCDRASDCVEGLACVNDICRQLCDPANSACGADFECNPFFDDAGYCEPK
ncbi:MAG: hypothetical protein IT385_21585 [Deltaproteobacteria bacterium]|nr:hypothetical protein [Deltaproteobacteria bacterium]